MPKKLTQNGPDSVMLSQCREHEELVAMVRGLCESLENEENEHREKKREKQKGCPENTKRPNNKTCGEKLAQISDRDNELLECTPCRQLDCNSGFEETAQNQRRNAIPDICTAMRGEVLSDHLYVNRFIRPNPNTVPLIVYPEYSPQDRPITPPPKTGDAHLVKAYGKCFCALRNGLQDECLRPDCRERQGCKDLPEPYCPNSCEAKLREARKICEGGRDGMPSHMYCPEL